MMDIAKALAFGWPNEQWTLSGDSYDGLNWQSQYPKPSLQELEAAWSDYILRRSVLVQIEELEASVTPRRLREAVTSQAGKDWLAGVDSQISVLRGQL